MAYRLTDPQETLVNLVSQQFLQKPTPQIRFFWRKLRACLLPDMPKPKRKNALEDALDQIRWQRVVALAADSHVAAASLLRDQIGLEREITAHIGEKIISPEKAMEILIQEVEQAPMKVQYRIFSSLLAKHPDWGASETEESVSPPQLSVISGGGGR